MEDDEVARASSATLGDDGHPQEDGDNGPPYPCPYRLANPRRYNDRQHAPCGVPLKDITAVQKHIKKHHLLFECVRCWERFPSNEALDHHQQRAAVRQGCEGRQRPQQYNTADGIRPATAALLNSKNISWERLWEIVFPEHPDVPPSKYKPCLKAEAMDFEDIIREAQQHVHRSLSLDRLLSRVDRAVVTVVTQAVRDRDKEWEEGLVFHLRAFERRISDEYHKTCLEAAAVKQTKPPSTKQRKPKASSQSSLQTRNVPVPIAARVVAPGPGMPQPQRRDGLEPLQQQVPGPAGNAHAPPAFTAHPLHNVQHPPHQHMTDMHPSAGVSYPPWLAQITTGAGVLPATSPMQHSPVNALGMPPPVLPWSGNGQGEQQLPQIFHARRASVGDGYPTHHQGPASIHGPSQSPLHPPSPSHPGPAPYGPQHHGY